MFLLYYTTGTNKNVPTHFLDARLTDAPEVLGPINEDAGDEVSQT